MKIRQYLKLCKLSNLLPQNSKYSIDICIKISPATFMKWASLRDNANFIYNRDFSLNSWFGWKKPGWALCLAALIFTLDMGHFMSNNVWWPTLIYNPEHKETKSIDLQCKLYTINPYEP